MANEIKTSPQEPRRAEDLPPPISGGRRVWRRFTKHRLAVFSMWLLAIFYIMMALAEFFAPYGMASEDRERAYQPPSSIHFVDDQGKLVGPYVRDIKKASDQGTLFQAGGTAEVALGEWVEDKTARYPIKLLAKGEPYKVLGVIPSDVHLFGVDTDRTRFYALGGDENGRDVLTRLFFGARVSLTVGIVALIIVIPMGTLVGGIAGYFGGWIDTALMWVVETIMAFPSFYLLLLLFGVTYKWDISPTQRYFLIITILSLISWTGLARVIRGMVLAIKQQEYVEAARAAGAGDMWIIVRHLLPQTATWVVISISLSIPGYIYGESVLSLLGLGVQPPDASWGNMLEGPSRNVSDLMLHPWLLSPGIAIVITTVAWNFFGDGLRDAFDAKRKV